MTLAMRSASKAALREYINRLPPAERAKYDGLHGGLKVNVNLKHELRYQAAIAAAPEAPG
jgi:hypothetical protein